MSTGPRYIQKFLSNKGVFTKNSMDKRWTSKVFYTLAWFIPHLLQNQRHLFLMNRNQH